MPVAVASFSMTFKEKIYHHCLQLVNEKIAALRHTLAGLRQSAANETKSTAGDKHETALAMLQIEQENTARQLNEVLLQKDMLQKIDATAPSTLAAAGSLLRTNKGYLFISIALGKMQVEGTAVVVLSLQSPLGAALRGMKAGDTANVNSTAYIIESVE
jgi:hypothetical protein